MFNADGIYTYTLDENATNDVQKINVEDRLPDSFTVILATGRFALDDVTAHSSTTQGTLLVTIQGANYSPVITGHDVLLVSQGNVLTTTPQEQLTITDMNDVVTSGESGKVTSFNRTFYLQDGGGNRLQSQEGTFGA